MGERQQGKAPVQVDRLRLDPVDRVGPAPEPDTSLGVWKLAGIAAAVAFGFGVILFLFRGSRDPQQFFYLLGWLTSRAAILGAVVGYLSRPRNTLWRVLGTLAGLWLGFGFVGRLLALLATP